MILAYFKVSLKIATMIARRAYHTVETALARQAGVVLLGPRQVGKTTLAHAIADSGDAIYLDLE